jgi:hypothetical protein
MTTYPPRQDSTTTALRTPGSGCQVMLSCPSRASLKTLVGNGSH